MVLEIVFALLIVALVVAVIVLANKIGSLHAVAVQLEEMKNIKQQLVSFKMGCDVGTSFRGFSARNDFYSANYSIEEKKIVAYKYTCDSILVKWNRIYLISVANGNRQEHNIDLCSLTENGAIDNYHRVVEQREKEKCIDCLYNPDNFLHN